MAKKKSASLSRAAQRRKKQHMRGSINATRRMLFDFHERCKAALDLDPELYAYQTELKEMERLVAAARAETNRGVIPDLSFIDEINKRCELKAQQKFEEEQQKLERERRQNRNVLTRAWARLTQ